jgi:outer membrane protein TolC
LLLKLQAIRNLEQNLGSLEQNLRAHEALAEAGIVSPLQVDQVFQSYQAGRLALIRASNDLENSLDAYKILMGIPPEFPVKLDDSRLDRFELNSSALLELEANINKLFDLVRGTEARFDDGQFNAMIAAMAEHVEQLSQQFTLVEVELQTWERALASRGLPPNDSTDRERRDQQLMRERVDESRRSVSTLREELANQLTSADHSNSEDDQGLLALERLVRNASRLVNDLFVIQTQVRTYSIELGTIEISEEDAIELALSRRLDLKNQQATVVDSWRKIRVAQDALEADLDLFLQADIATQATSNNPVAFSAAASTYRVGVAFDGPLNRLAERNNYRAELINYQRRRRDWIGLRDGVVQSVRRDLRTLEAERLNFEISRQSLIAAARQVEQARLQLLAPDQSGDSSTTQDALNALSSLLASKNSLIASWVAYETARMQLLLDIESLDLDQYGPIENESPARVNPPRTIRSEGSRSAGT